MSNSSLALPVLHEDSVATFVCEGFLAIDQAHALRFTLRIFHDGALTIAIAPETNQLDPTHPRAVDPDCHAYDGRVVSVTNDPDSVDPSYQCSFKLVRFWRHQFQSQFLVCHARLSATKGLHGHYVVVHGDDDRPHAHEVALPIPLQLLPVAHAVGPLLMPMRPLTPGAYRLQGFTVTTSGTVYECIVELELHADGVVRGRSHDLLFPQQCELRGKWTQDEVVYTLEYKLSQASSSRYLYTVTPSLGGLRGRWAHEDPVRSQRRTERGHVELRLESATRQWSRAFHTLYPRVFQHAAKLLLVRALPSALWQHVFSYCDFHHFAPSAPTAIQ